MVSDLLRLHVTVGLQVPANIRGIRCWGGAGNPRAVVRTNNPALARRRRTGGTRRCGCPGGSDRLAVAEELVVRVVAAVATADLGHVGDEIDAGQPLHLFEPELNLVA